MASFYNRGSYYEWTDDERSKYTLGNVYTDIPTSAFQGLITQVIPAYTEIYKVEMSVYWKTGVGVTNGDGYLYIGDTQIGGKWQTSNKYITSPVPNSVHGYFQSGTANAGLPSSTIRFRSEASWGRTFYFTVTIKWYPYYNITVNNGTGGGRVTMGSSTTITATVPTGYSFKQWNDGNTQNPRTISNISTHQTYTAQFEKLKYTITFKNWDGSVLQSGLVEYGTTPSYSGTPTRPEDDNYIYTFSGWSPSVSSVTGNAEYIAQYTATLKKINKIYIGTSQPKDIYIGNQKVKEVYIGNTKIYG